MALRFKIQHKGSPVTLSLEQDKVLRHFEFAYHDEGWESVARDWRLVRDQEGDLIQYEIHSDGTDCDGRLSRDTELLARVNMLDGWPNWITTGGSQRDYAAEAMGY